jgi:hypothetical protein
MYYKTIFTKLTLSILSILSRKSKTFNFCALFFLIITMLPFHCFAKKDNALLKCLGIEELKIHRAKSEGPLYRLNQLLINKLASFNNLILREAYYQEICKNKNFSPSLALIKSILLNRKKIFDPKSFHENASIKSYQMASLESLSGEMAHVFFNYLSQIQALTPTAKCLEKNMPELGLFLERYKYLETDYSPDVLLEEKSKLNSIFNKLQRLDSILKRCEKEKKSKAVKGRK